MVSFIGGGNQSTRRKLPTWRKSLTKLCLVRLYLQLFVGGFMSYLRYMCLFVCGVKHICTIWKTRRMSYRRQELLAIRGRLGSSPVFCVVLLPHVFSFLCCVFALFVFVLLTRCYQFLWIVHSWLHIFSRFCFHLIKSVHNIIKNKYSTSS